MPSVDRVTCRTCCRGHVDRKRLWSHLTKRGKHKRPRHASNIAEDVKEDPDPLHTIDDPLSSLPYDPSEGLLIKGLAKRDSEEPGISMAIPYYHDSPPAQHHAPLPYHYAHPPEHPPPDDPPPYANEHGLSIRGCANRVHVQNPQPRFFGLPGGPNPNDVAEIRPKQETPDKENWLPHHHQFMRSQHGGTGPETDIPSSTAFIGRYPVGGPF